MTPDPSPSPAAGPGPDLDAVVVGAGFAGLYMLHRLRGMGLRARVFEQGSGIGGTWFWNAYPGARCDVESLEYSYQFDEDLQQEWEWTERYATQPEILRYIEHVADRFDLRRDVRLDTRVETARFDEESGCWQVETSAGDRVSARFCIFATGCLSMPNTPEFPGRERFAGEVYHTGRWPREEVDFRGKRVGVIGTGSSGIQSIPLIAEQARELVVFQRTPNYSVPAQNRPLDPEEVARVKADYRGFRERNAQMPSGFGSKLPADGKLASQATPEQLRQRYEERWANGGLPFLGAFSDLLFDDVANRTAADFVREKIREQVDDPEVAALLSPDTLIGCKRLCADSDYYRTFNRENVRLVDVSASPIQEITETGLRTGEESFELDCLVFATGFDAMTGALLAVDIRGRGDRSLREKWAEGPRAYLGLAMAGFPNLFTITGPGSPSVLTNMLPSIEQHVNWIADCLAYMEAQGFERIEPEPEAEDAWVAHVNQVAELTIFPRCNSWYVGANVPGKPRVFMPYLGFPTYVQRCNEVVAKGYEGFAFGS